jgi:hypothetical protein
MKGVLPMSKKVNRANPAINRHITDTSWPIYWRTNRRSPETDHLFFRISASRFLLMYWNIEINAIRAETATRAKGP